MGISAQIDKPRGGAGRRPGIGFQGISIRIEWERMFAHSEIDRNADRLRLVSQGYVGLPRPSSSASAARVSTESLSIAQEWPQ